MDIKFNIYYATDLNGPWTLANNTPIDRINTGNEFTISGLNTNTLYYTRVIGGIVQDNQFYPLMSQSIGPKTKNTGDIETIPGDYAIVRTFGPNLEDLSTLGHQFDMNGFLGESLLAHQFTIEASGFSTLAHQFAVATADDSVLSHQFEILTQQDYWLLGGSWSIASQNLFTQWSDTPGDASTWTKTNYPTKFTYLRNQNIACNVDHPRRWIMAGQDYEGTQGEIRASSAAYFDTEGRAEWWSDNSFDQALGAEIHANATTNYCNMIMHNGLTGNDGRYVVGLNNGRMLYSVSGHDGTGWVDAFFSSSNPTSATYRSDIGRYVLVHNNSGTPLHTSTDATSWTTAGLSGVPAVALWGVAQSTVSGLFVAVGNSGTCIKSTDGLTWSTVTTPTSNPIKDVVYEPLRNMWFMVGGSSGMFGSGEIHWTSDFTTWFAVSGLAGQVDSITHDSSGKIIAAGLGNNIHIANYPGTTFTTHEDILGLDTGTLNRMRIAHSATVPRT